MVPGTGIAWLFSRRLGKRGYSAGSIRKISEGIAMVTEAVCLIGVGKILFWSTYLQGIRGQSGFFNWALRERNIQLRLYFKIDLKS